MTANWLNRNEYPFTHRYFNINGHKLHYIDEGEGETILFVHGTPSWSFDFRQVIKSLQAGYRCIAIDHIGFGLSDKPETYDYSTLRHSEALEAFAEALDLKEITLVVHDFGGPVGLNFAIRHPGKIRKIVVLNSWMWSSKHEPEFIRFSRILKSPLLPFLYKYLNFSARFVMPSSFGDKKLPDRLRSQYTGPFIRPSERHGTVAFAKSLLNDQDWFETLWINREAIASRPVLLIWGMKDRFITPKYLEKFLAGFSNARARRLETCGHFPQEEEPELVSEYIHEFVKKS
jgi:pimeloyl-ACP methyl ester carboxylesterase